MMHYHAPVESVRRRLKLNLAVGRFISPTAPDESKSFNLIENEPSVLRRGEVYDIMSKLMRLLGYQMCDFKHARKIKNGQASLCSTESLAMTLPQDFSKLQPCILTIFLVWTQLKSQ
jgi:hypothetical protein